ncbi:MAG: hypothetical protein LUE98_12400 [Tannerellaceae bacterium]|nr:hypothetical protein [Lachnospiraceae bacterium]MCD8178168.1 hypothetical protein [Tannerellaceae bacterium]
MAGKYGNLLDNVMNKEYEEKTYGGLIDNAVNHREDDTMMATAERLTNAIIQGKLDEINRQNAFIAEREEKQRREQERQNKISTVRDKYLDIYKGKVEADNKRKADEQKAVEDAERMRRVHENLNWKPKNI